MVPVVVHARKRTQLNNLEETVQKAQPEIKRNTDRIDELNARHTSLDETSNQFQNSLTGLHSQVAIFESRYIETVEKIKEITVLTNTIQVQLNQQEKNMLEQSADNLSVTPG